MTSITTTDSERDKSSQQSIRQGVDHAAALRYHRAMSLIRGLFWLILFAFFTFCFIVLFEYGTHDFTTGFKKEAQRVKEFVVQTANKPKSDKSPADKKR